MAARLSHRELGWYGLVTAMGAAIALTAVSQLAPGRDTVLWGLLFSALTFLSLFRRVRLSSDDYHSVYTLDDVPIYALMFLKGWALTALVAGGSRLAYEVYRLARARWLHPERINIVHVIYHFSDVPIVAVVAALTGMTYQAVNQGTPLLGSAQNLAAIVAATAVWFPLAFGANAINLTLRRGQRLSKVLPIMQENLAHIKIHVAMLVPLGALLAVFLAKAPLAAALLVVPVVLMHGALDAQHKLQEESRRTIQALAHYLEERDQYTLGHSARVSEYSVEIARQMGLGAGEVDQVRRAGLIHDIGKVDIPDAILRKPGHLTADEREVMRTHVDRAVHLGQKLVALRRELPFREAAYHHENYDGTGHYRLAGDHIPLASRILAVADTYDAMTSDRPYRKGMPTPEAITRLQKASGTQLDPRVVQAFLLAHGQGRIERVAHEWAEQQQGCQPEMGVLQ